MGESKAHPKEHLIASFRGNCGEAVAGAKRGHHSVKGENTGAKVVLDFSIQSSTKIEYGMFMSKDSTSSAS